MVNVFIRQMKIRLPKVNELDKLKELHSQLENEFPFPDLSLVSSISVVVDDNDNIIGFGIIQPIFETIVVLDRTQTREVRLEVFQSLINKCEYELKEQGITQYHAFVQTKKFYNLLKKRFGFKVIKGDALVKVING